MVMAGSTTVPTIDLCRSSARHRQTRLLAVELTEMKIIVIAISMMLGVGVSNAYAACDGSHNNTKRAIHGTVVEVVPAEDEGTSPRLTIADDATECRLLIEVSQECAVGQTFTIDDSEWSYLLEQERQETKADYEVEGNGEFQCQ